MGDHAVELGVFIVLFGVIAVMGFVASRWKPGETMHHLDEWGLGGRNVGTWISWFLIVPAVGIGLFTRWFHRGGLVAGWAVGMVVAVKLLYDIPKKDPATGEIVKAHFGGSGYPLANLGFDTDVSLWAGILAIAANLLVAAVVTVVLRAGSRVSR